MAYGADSWARARELSALLDQVRTGSATVTYADGRIAATVRYTQPLLGSASVPESVRAGLGRIVAGEARAQLTPVARARSDTRHLRVLPWHRALLRARNGYVAYLDVRLAHLRAGADDARVLLRADPAGTRAAAEAERALVAAGASPAAARAALATTAG